MSLKSGRRKGKKVIREFSAGGVVFKKTPKSLLWLIIKPSGSNRWQLPKGRVDAGESSKEAALREVAKEGGVDVRLVDKIGTSQYFFVFKGQKEGHDHEVDEAIFLDFDEAEARLTFKDDKKMLKKGREILQRGIQGNLI